MLPPHGVKVTALGHIHIATSVRREGVLRLEFKTPFKKIWLCNSCFLAIYILLPICRIYKLLVILRLRINKDSYKVFLPCAERLARLEPGSGSRIGNKAIIISAKQQSHTEEYGVVHGSSNHTRKNTKE